MNQKSGVSRRSSRQPFTEKQGEYLAFIYVYSHMFQRPPAETDMQRYFRVSPPSVHQMVLTLERAGLIRRQPGVARIVEMIARADDDFLVRHGMRKGTMSLIVEHQAERIYETMGPAVAISGGSAA